MYIDLIVLIALIVIVIMFFKRFSSFVFFVAIVDILLRILTFIKDNIGLPDVSQLIGKYIPANIPYIIGEYTNGVFYTIIVWLYVGIMAIFLSYIIKIFWKKKKI